MPTLHTHMEESELAVLVIGSPSAVLDVVVKKLRGVGIRPVVWNPQEIESPPDLGVHVDIYKTCWILDEKTRNSGAAERVFQTLYTLNVPHVVCGVTVAARWGGEKAAQLRAAHLALFAHIHTHLPKTAVVVFEDWVGESDAFLHLVHVLEENQWLQIKSGVREEIFSEYVVKRIAQPHRSGFFTPGVSEVVSTKSLSVAKKQPEPVSTPCGVVHGDGLRSHPQLATSKKLIQKKPPQVVKKDSRVAHHRTPQIYNRQVQYQRQLAHVKQSQKRKQTLTPLSRGVASHPPPPLPKKADLQPLERQLEQTIQRLFGSQREEYRGQRLDTKVQKTLKVRKKLSRQRLVFRIVAVFGMVGVVCVINIAAFFTLRMALFSSLLSGESSSSLVGRATMIASRAASFVLATQVGVVQSVFGQEVLPETAAVVGALRQLQTVSEQEGELTERGDLILEQVLGKGQGSVFSTLLETSALQQNLYASLSVIQSHLQSLSVEFLPEGEQRMIGDLLSRVQKTRRELAILGQLQQLFPTFLGQLQRQRIAVLLQDSQELRPSGGVVRGVVLLTVQNGLLIDQQYYSTEMLEQAHLGRVTASPAYQRAFGAQTTKLLDAGWDPDFSQTASFVSEYLDRGVGRKPDLVIGIHTLTLQKLLARIGPLQRPTSGEVVSAANIFERLEVQTQDEYLGNIFSEVFQKVFAEPTNTKVLLEVLFEGLQQGQVFLASPIQTQQEVFASLGWTGGVTTPPCPQALGSAECVKSSIFYSDTSIGTNRVNPQVVQKTNHQMTVSPDKITHVRTIDYTNNSSSTRWPAGTYRSYVRVFLPKQIGLSRVQIDDRLIELNSLDRAETAMGQYLGFVVDVPIQKTVRVQVEYSELFTYESGATLTFFDQKQAGTPADQYTLSINLESVQAAVVAPKPRVEGSLLTFSSDRQQHYFVGLKLR